MSRSLHTSETLLTIPLLKGSRVYLGEGLFYEAGEGTELTVTAPKNEHLPLLGWLHAPLSDTAPSDKGASGEYSAGG
jgi:hypothetical protein